MVEPAAKKSKSHTPSKFQDLVGFQSIFGPKPSLLPKTMMPQSPSKMQSVPKDAVIIDLDGWESDWDSDVIVDEERSCPAIKDEPIEIKDVGSPSCTPQ